MPAESCRGSSPAPGGGSGEAEPYEHVGKVGALGPNPWTQVVIALDFSSQETEPTEQAADASEQAADTSKQNTENPEVTAQQEMDTDLPEAPPPPLEPAVMARPSCVNLSIHSIVEDRRPKERIDLLLSSVSRESSVEVWYKDWGCASPASLWTFSLCMGREEIQLLPCPADNFPEKMGSR